MTSCYFLEPTHTYAISVRRFGFGPDTTKPDRHACEGREPWGSGYRSGCDASSAAFETRAMVMREDGVFPRPEDVPRDHPMWPTVCEHCGRAFEDEEWQTNSDPIYRVAAVVPGAALAVGELVTWGDAPPGAMRYIEWMHYARGPDGKTLQAKCPESPVAKASAGDWVIDSRASNCTRPDDDEHRCWVRDGVPPYVTAGKDGNTCSAGAGSIQTPYYHGFLRDGIFT